MAGNPPGHTACPHQLERREQPPAIVAGQDAARNQLSGHRRGIETLAAEAARDPESFAKLADLRHAMHGLASRPAESLGDVDVAKLWEYGADATRDGACKALRPHRPGGLRARPHQPVTIDNPEMIDTGAVEHRASKADRLGKLGAERCCDPAIAPDRQQRIRQPP